MIGLRLGPAISVVFFALGCGSAVETDDGESTGDGSGEASTTSTSSTTAESTRTTAPDTTDVTTSTTGGVGLVDGTYLFAVSTLLAPDLPLQYLARVRGDGRESSLELVPLSLATSSTTEPREPLEEFATNVGEIAVGPDGRFEFILPEQFVPGAANPITGSDILFTGIFEAQASSSLFCGTLNGEVISPITADLTGSTFAGILIDEDAPLPVEFPVSC